MFSWDVTTDPDLHWPLLKLKYALCCGSGFFFDADPDPDFYLMRMQIRITFHFDADHEKDPAFLWGSGSDRSCQNDEDPDPQHCM